MHSDALDTWRRDRLARIDDLFAAHRAIGGRGRRSGHVRAQITSACIVMLAAEWQGFCRDLHNEAADEIASATSPPGLRRPLRYALTLGRRVDVGNADAADVGNDFARFNNMKVWHDVDALDKRNVVRRRRLRQLYAWRNAIVHHDFDRIDRDLVGDTRPTLEWARRWRAACDQLAYQTDRVVTAQLVTLLGALPPRLALAKAA